MEDERPPFCIFSPDVTYDEDILLQASMAYVQEPLADGVCGPIPELARRTKPRAAGVTCAVSDMTTAWTPSAGSR